MVGRYGVSLMDKIVGTILSKTTTTTTNIRLSRKLEPVNRSSGKSWAHPIAKHQNKIEIASLSDIKTQIQNQPTIKKEISERHET